jgi:hypothetical protein
MKPEIIEKIRKHDEIIAEAREKYTVHHCGQCEFRKSCNLSENGFDSDECKERRQSIMLGFGIEDGYFTKLLDRLEAAHKREKAAIEADALAVGGFVEASRATSEKSSAVGNAAAMREALRRCANYLDVDDAGLCKDECDALREVTQSATSAPPRNCDRFFNANDALEAFKKEKGETIIEFIRWIFAEAKGEN